MRHVISTFSILVCCLLLSTGLYAAKKAGSATMVEMPSNGNFVVDQAHLLSPEAITKINEISGALWQEEDIPLVVVTIESLAKQNALKYSIERYTQALFNHWKLGYKDRNYGILIVISKRDRKARIEFGADWDHRHDNDAKTIMQDYMVPRFKEGDFSTGTIDGVQALNNLARGLALPAVKHPWWVMPLFFLILAATIGIIVSLFRSGRSGWGWMFLVALGAFLWLVLSSSGSGNGGSYSGGGSSGGGGATGSW